MRYGPPVVALLSLTCVGTSLGIVVPDPAQYVQRPDHAYVGRLQSGSCVPIGARYALTANHVGVAGNAKLQLDGVRYTIKRGIPHPLAPVVDFKIVEIKGPPYFTDWVPLHPAPTLVPPHTPIYIGGTGYCCTQPASGCVAWDERDERWATNEIEGYFNSSVSYAWYRFDMEIPHEGMATLYDSGSPMLVMDDDSCQLELMGIATSATTASGPSCDGHTAYYLLVNDPWLQQFTGPLCQGDLDRDGDTDVFDFLWLVKDFDSDSGDCSTQWRGDINGDGTIDINDFAALAASFGCTP